MRIMLINPPNADRSIHEEEYGITAVKEIFRGEPFLQTWSPRATLVPQASLASWKSYFNPENYRPVRNYFVLFLKAVVFRSLI